MNINRVVLTGNLTRDPELRATTNNLSICKLGIACNTRRKNGQTGQWEEKPNFFRVTVFGAQAENCSKYLQKGRPVAIDGRLEWSQYEDSNGQKRESVDIIADSVQFLGSGRDDAGNGNGFSSSVPATESDVSIDTRDFETASVSAGGDDDIPF
ncbi:MAG TPA: single-stranded DNA-binding protein [Solirubrobacteraceae bacterium]|jgi:single-strand DNA-binding protein